MKTALIIVSLLFAANSWSGDRRLQQVLQSTKSGEPVFEVYGLGQKCHTDKSDNKVVRCKCTLYRENGTVVPNCFLCSDSGVYCSTDYIAYPWKP